jgi:hypothetical protein
MARSLVRYMSKMYNASWLEEKKLTPVKPWPLTGGPTGAATVAAGAGSAVSFVATLLSGWLDLYM